MHVHRHGSTLSRKGDKSAVTVRIPRVTLMHYNTHPSFTTCVR